MTDDIPSEGGTTWEVGVSGQQMIDARRSGDIDAEVLALIRFSEGLRNISLEVVGKVIGPLDGKIDILAGLVGDLVSAHKQDEQQNQYRATALYRQMGDFIKNVDARLDRFGTDQESLLSAVQGVASRLGKIEDGQIAIHLRLETGERERAAMAEKLDRYIAGSRRADVDALQEQIRELRGPEMPPEQRQRYISILMRMIAEWEAAHPGDIP